MPAALGFSTLYRYAALIESYGLFGKLSERSSSILRMSMRSPPSLERLRPRCAVTLQDAAIT